MKKKDGPDEPLFPPIAENFLIRSNVNNLIINSLQKPITTVVAGAGYGKTQAVLAALKLMECKTVWLQLSELDNHVARFWKRIASALALYSQSLCESLMSLGYPESIAAYDQFLRLLKRKLRQDEHFVLVFDDFYFINNKSIINFFELFISSGFQNVSIVIISREKPDLNLTSMMYKGLLACITKDDLRFSKDEMEEYFKMQGFNLSENISLDIYSYTSGWVFAIYLVGLAIKKGGVDAQNPILAAKIDIFDLIEREIFGVISKEMQDFLIKISVLYTMPTGLLKELVHNDHTLISQMTQISQFIEYDSFSDGYRIHHLFKDFLLERKDRLKKCEIMETHLIAAKWYEKKNFEFEAIDHYKECNMYDEIFDIILPVTRRVSKETADSFIKLIEEAPKEIVMARPIILVAKARFMFNNNKIPEAKQELFNIRRSFESVRTEENKAVLGEAYILLALISIVNLDYQFVELFKMADECLPYGSSMVNHKVSIAEGINVCSIRNPAPGELKRHQDALFNAAPFASRVMNGCGYGMEYLNAAESSLYTGDLKAAEKYSYETIYRSRKYEQYDIEYMANFVLVRIFIAKGNYAKLSDLLNQMENQLLSLQNPDCVYLYDIIKGWCYVKIKKTDKIAKWIKHEEEIRKMLAPVVLGREYLVRSDCLLAEERYYELLAFMGHTDRMYEERGILYARVQNKITKAIIHHSLDNHEESMDALFEAYELTNPNNLIMQYVEYGNKMRTLIHAARLNKYCKIPGDWLDNIYTKSSTYAKQLTKIISSYDEANELVDDDQTKLSKRESEMLAYLCQGMTRDEIAESCYLSVNTVKGILKTIYSKLGAVNAADAVRITKEKNLL